MGAAEKIDLGEIQKENLREKLGQSWGQPWGQTWAIPKKNTERKL